MGRPGYIEGLLLTLAKYKDSTITEGQAIDEIVTASYDFFSALGLFDEEVEKQ